METKELQQSNLEPTVIETEDPFQSSVLTALRLIYAQLTEINDSLKATKVTQPTAQTDSPQGDAPICPTHHVPLRWLTGESKKTGKPYAFYACSEKMPDGSFCPYKPQR